jgi:mono/diheme cytochrome c family protein
LNARPPSRLVRTLFLALALVGAASLAGAVVLAALVGNALRRGFSARDEPSALAAREARTLSMRGAAARKDPLPPSEGRLAAGRAHFADHCATCHGNDGSGQTEIGQHLYPKAPDMRLAATQSLSDGELFAIIANGVRLTGMPAWGDERGDDGETWALVRFIRHLPALTSGERAAMEKLNPAAPGELKEEHEEDQFLEGPDSAPSSTTHQEVK